MTSVSLILEEFIVISLSPCAPVKPASCSDTCDLRLFGLPGQCSGAPFRAKFESEAKFFIPDRMRGRLRKARSV
jgi:hypothetical protein